jgi:signal transduction histidine kinase
MADTVEETVATLRRFIADAAHEMHTPLTALATNLSLLEQQPSSHNLTQAQLQLKRLETLTSNLLDLSRLESITQPPSPSMINLTQMVQEIGELYASQAEQAEIEFELQTPESVDVLAYPTQLRQALHNVLDNALKFTLAGGKVILQVKKATAQTIITVQDTGIGIPPSDLPHLFNRFHRGENAGNYAGNGLGLAIVKAIVNQHNGTIHIQSSPHGTTATITLPR